LLSDREPQTFIKYQVALFRLTLAALILPLPRFGNGGDKLRPAAAFDDMPGGLTAGVQFPITCRLSIRGIENRLIKKGLAFTALGSNLLSFL
jgi:hypothetical protein